MITPARSKGLFQIHVAVFLFGFAGLFAKFIDAGPMVIVLGRTLFASLALAVFIRVPPGKNNKKVRLEELPWYVAQGVLLAVHWWAFFHAIQLSTVAIGLLTFSTFPLFVTFLEPLFFKEPLTRFNILTAFLVFIGMVLVIPGLDLSDQYTMGGLWGVFSGLTFALLAMVNRKSVQSTDAVTISFFQNLFAAGFMALPLLLSSSAVPLPSTRDILLLMVLGVLCTATAHTLFISSLSVIMAQTASIITALEPVYGIILAGLFLNEIPGPRTLAGGVLILATTIAAGLYKQPEKAPGVNRSPGS